MVIKKIIVDHKPNSCMPCPLKHSHDCGQMIKKQESSGGACDIKVPDKRCLLRNEYE